MKKNVLNNINSCVVIPTYNNSKTLENVINDVLEYTSDVIVVNDGSTDVTSDILSRYNSLIIINHKTNKGKGKALKSGFFKAIELNYDYAITIDSDGQHYPSDIPKFAKEIKENGEALLIGDRNMTQDGIPSNSSFGNKISNFWFWIETGIKLKDTQSGFRLYPLNPLKKLNLFTTKFEFEIEIIVKMAWNNIVIKNIPINILYDKNERVSHFRPIRDFTRISILNTYLVIIALLYIKPRDYFKSVYKKGFKRFFFEDVLASDDSSLKKTLSITLGIFIGLSPFWGFHTFLAIFLSVFFGLNKIITFAFSNISLPPFIPFIIFAGYKTGNLLIGNNIDYNSFSFDYYKNYNIQNITEYIIGSIVFALFASLIIGVVFYVILEILNKFKLSSRRTLK